MKRKTDGEMAYFVVIPASSGMGCEVMPFAVITDGRTGTKYLGADYELFPNMAIIGADNMMNISWIILIRWLKMRLTTSVPVQTQDIR